MSEFVWPVRVYYEDTDAGGVVFYANYLKFFERARTEMLRARGVSQQELLENKGLVFVVRRVHVEYRQSARLDDLLEISARPRLAGRARLVFEQEARRASDRNVLCRGEAEIVCVTADGFRPQPLPPCILEILPS
ncbi:tol-pal system-associated acyl-CoA thioesterase [Thiofaba sp. EF100]|uniref:tol-pal system-associated acyl-CoA thioesterase n=1 Tax=Thiofaba sp. EF100 TaxID=3121274 RepID=UPI00322219F6